MRNSETILLKDGRECVLRSGTAEDAQGVLDNFLLTHAQTDELLTYPEEFTFTADQEAAFLQARAESPDEVHLVAVVDGKIVGTAGVDRISRLEKIRHRANFGISVEKDYWGLGIGKAMTLACVECAKKAGYVQLELEVVADNERAIALYESAGFTEYGRNPKGFRSRVTGWQEVVSMRLEL
ncbi:MAG: GNAT family N-acetyltransferase [Firmicutes bacterium]|nr:GNAT family N-acetyltransferase [Bacillota bacterium]